MPSRTVIAITAPPRCGKNTLTEQIVNEVNAREGWLGVHISLSAPMKQIAHMLLGKEYSEEQKDQPLLQDGHSPRDAYIHIGQMDLYDAELWGRVGGKMIYDLIKDNPHHNIIFVIDSIGKQAQWDGLKKYLHARFEDTVRTLLMSLTRTGVEWTDNRTPVTDSRVGIITNDKTIEDLKRKAKTLVDIVTMERT